MDWKVFFGTFFMVFWAELGDKTQLCALAQSAAHGKWIVFLAASAALVLATLLAVIFGDALARYIPARAIHALAGTLFIAFGILLLLSVFKPTP